MTAATATVRTNDVTERERIWQRFTGDDWTCFDALPPALRQRLREHAYDAWAVNAWTAWRTERRRVGSERAQRRLLRWLDECERLERAAFAESYRRRYEAALPHDAARVTVLRYGRPVTPAVQLPRRCP
ncbi:MAG: DUF6525 family protein [Alphaproteobacteria bacterium]|nr:DUF6525 family protein [Alphaproteobacteria bacterium]